MDFTLPNPPATRLSAPGWYVRCLNEPVSPANRMTITRSISRRSSGFSLIELMVSAAILALVVGGFYITFNGANEFAAKSRLNYSAKVILNSAISEALGARWKANSVVPQVLSTPTNPSGDGFALYPGLPTDPGNQATDGSPYAQTNGVVSLYTTPPDLAIATPGDNLVVGTLKRKATKVSPDLVLLTFKVEYSYKGVAIEPVIAYTAVSRDD